MRTFWATVAIGLVAGTALAGRPPLGSQKASADRNRDGIITDQEIQARRDYGIRYELQSEPVRSVEGDIDGDGFPDLPDNPSLRERMDKDGDGTVSDAERRAYFRSWNHQVATSLESMYDTNRNGVLEWPEARELLLARLLLIQKMGRATPESAIEREFDANGDGILDPGETAEIRAAVN